MTLAIARAAGSHRELGRAQGEAFAEGIARSIDLYEALGRRSHQRMASLASRCGPYMDEARRELPQLVDELQGMAEGADADFDALVVLNCLEEVWDFEACTTMIHGRFLMHAEQWFAEHSDIGLVVARPDNGPPFVSPTCVGFLPAVGMSAGGFAQGVDSLTAHDDRVGIPRVFVSRMALGAADVSDAMTKASMRKRAGGYAHVFASLDRNVVVETTSASYELLDIEAHTNHYQSRWLRSLDAPPSPGSLSRLVRACRLLAERPPSTLEACTRLLADHVGEPQSICLHEKGFAGSGTVLGMACDVATGRMLVSDGPPCEGRWHDFEVPAYAALGASGVG